VPITREVNWHTQLQQNICENDIFIALVAKQMVTAEIQRLKLEDSFYNIITLTDISKNKFS